MKSAVLFRNGDHWQGGAAWTGPTPAAGDANASEVMTRIQREFVSSNVIAKVVERHTNGAIGREPQWSYAVRRPLLEEEQPTNPARPDRRGRSRDDELVGSAQWAGYPARNHCDGGDPWPRGAALICSTSRCRRRGDSTPTNLGRCLNLIWLDLLPPEQAGVSRDKQTMQAAGVYVYTNDDKTEVAEVTFLDGLDTVVRTLEGEAVTGETRLPPDGALTDAGNHL